MTALRDLHEAIRERDRELARLRLLVRNDAVEIRRILEQDFIQPNTRARLEARLAARPAR